MIVYVTGKKQNPQIFSREIVLFVEINIDIRIFVLGELICILKGQLYNITTTVIKVLMESKESARLFHMSIPKLAISY